MKSEIKVCDDLVYDFILQKETIKKEEAQEA